MRLGYLFLLIVGLLLGTLTIVWWARFRRIPTLRLTYVIGKGGRIDLDWIDI